MKNYELLLTALLVLFTEPQPMIRARVVRTVASLLKTDPELILRDAMRGAITDRFCDVAISVREEAVKLVGAFVVGGFDISTGYMDGLLMRLSDKVCTSSSRIIISYHHLVSSSHIIISYHHLILSSHIIISYHHPVSSSRIIISCIMLTPYRYLLVFLIVPSLVFFFTGCICTQVCCKYFQRSPSLPAHASSVLRNMPSTTGARLASQGRGDYPGSCSGDFPAGLVPSAIGCCFDCFISCSSTHYFT